MHIKLGSDQYGVCNNYTLAGGRELTYLDVEKTNAIITLGAFLFSVALGVIFGMYPAVKASGLQPVVAQRAE